MSAYFRLFFMVPLVSVFCFAQYVRLGTLGRRRTRQALKYVYCGVKLALAIPLIPALWALFWVFPEIFKVVFTALWPHLDILREDGSLYLRRFFMTPKTQWYRPRFLHYIAQGDTGRDPHDHPGPFITTILYGGYEERVYFPREMGRRRAHGLFESHVVLPGDTLRNSAGHTHIVTLIAPTWTWVVGWIRGKPWGFWQLDPEDSSKDVWTESEQYGVKGEEIKSWEIRT